ncbi:hypothetical protein IIZ77_03030 [Candidatus Saccharibacteria bacterium]|nr:hypothetical protein [Candidatus Saccharibacteria bacterium]
MENSPSASDDIILPEADVEIHVEPPSPKSRKKTTLWLIVAAIGFLALSGALVFVITNNKPKEEPEPSVVKPSSEEENFKYDTAVFNDIVDRSEEHIKKGDYLAAQKLLDQYSMPERMTTAQKYRYYSTLALLYAENAMNDLGLHDQYEALANQSLEAIRKGEE